MAELGTLDILSEIEAIVSDKLQVVSYKWLSRNFSMPSNDAKRLLQEFAEQRGSELKVIYTLSGWLKYDGPEYHTRLVSSLKLKEIKKEFEDNCSIQVYSVQACIPKDSAVLWNAEFAQTEELFNQPSTVDNCLRDNRFCGVSNSFVKRNANRPSTGVAKQPTIVGVAMSSSSAKVQIPSFPQQLQGKIHKVSPKIEHPPKVVSPVVKNVSNTNFNAQAVRPSAEKEKVNAFPANKKIIQNEQSSSGTGGSLANMWGRASTKQKGLKPDCAPAETNTAIPNPVVTVEDEICAREATDAVISDDDGQDFNHKRSFSGQGSRKRKVVLDFSDEEDDVDTVINLDLRDPPKKHSSRDFKHATKNLAFEENDLRSEVHKMDLLKIKVEKPTSPETEAVVASKKKSKASKISLSLKSPVDKPGDDAVAKDNTTDANSKRRKVLKTRIDERGREVTEVVREGEEAETKIADKDIKIADTANARPPQVAKKSPAFGSNAQPNPVGKAGAKKGKGVTKDPKQGNILSFFKKV
ncbi:hypothetical protein GIB67_022408 [Kingdonia uniflora]|uniref:DNA polymerase delta subunit 3 n=1 Tax=Kingdonia uniflora TaxID=39325 RepID=A0A7J7MUG3_9MAGN|nr:hypothetical protein GIB67_022408 [Kingdonia uniflora]